MPWEKHYPVEHDQLLGLLDDNHTQYALLAGRVGGQIFYGSTLASENLRIGSTSNATKGNVRCDSTLAPHVNNTYDLGTTGLKWKRLITIEGMEIAALQYAFRVTGTTSGMYFDSLSPRNIALHINGAQIHTFYMGSPADEGAQWQLQRTSNPTNATNPGTWYTFDNGIGDAWFKLMSQGVWVDVQQREEIAITPSATITFTHNEHTDIFSTWTAGENETINASGTQKAGQNMHLVIECDGTPRVITYGTGFRANGTATLIINTAGVFHFVSNGTDWCEVARTLGV